MGAKITTMHGGKEVWKYGEAGDHYPIMPGEVWKIGDHILACGDHARGAAKEFLDTYGEPTYVYSDPPWNQGNVNSFRTKAGLEHDTRGFNLFLDSFCDAATRSKAAFVEMGVKELPLLQVAMSTRGWTMVHHWLVAYYGDRPCELGLFAPSGSHLSSGFLPSVDPTGMDDADTPGWAMAQIGQAGDVWFDPCMGQGCTAEHAVRSGMLVRGVELHPRRLACTFEKIVKLTGLVPVKVGDLSCMK